MGLLKNAVGRGLSEGLTKGIGKGISNAVGKAVESAVAPTAKKYADAMGNEISASADALNQSAAELRAATGELQATTETEEFKAATASAGGLEGLFSGYISAAENYATSMSMNMKECPECGATTTMDRQFCPECGARLPDHSMGQGYICTKCGKQNTVGTKFCAVCGEVLPAAAEQVARERAERQAEIEAQKQAELEAKRRAEEAEARRAAAAAKNSFGLSGLKNDLKKKATDLGGNVADSALNAAGNLFNRFKNK